MHLEYKKIEKKEWKKNEEIMKVTLPRPGHADLAGVQKFEFDVQPTFS